MGHRLDMGTGPQLHGPKVLLHGLLAALHHRVQGILKGIAGLENVPIAIAMSLFFTLLGIPGLPGDYVSNGAVLRRTLELFWGAHTLTYLSILWLCCVGPFRFRFPPVLHHFPHSIPFFGGHRPSAGSSRFAIANRKRGLTALSVAGSSFIKSV